MALMGLANRVTGSQRSTLPQKSTVMRGAGNDIDCVICWKTSGSVREERGCHCVVEACLGVTLLRHSPRGEAQRFDQSSSEGRVLGTRHLCVLNAGHCLPSLSAWLLMAGTGDVVFSNVKESTHHEDRPRFQKSIPSSTSFHHTCIRNRVLASHDKGAAGLNANRRGRAAVTQMIAAIL